VLNNTTGTSTFTFSTITDLSTSYSFYLTTSSITAYPVTVSFDRSLLVGPYSSVYPINANIKKVSSGYTVRNFINQGSYNSSTETYDAANIIYLYTGITSINGNKFFLMF
jgi:hypothetical protein